MNMENRIIDNEVKWDSDEITTKEKLESFSSEMSHYWTIELLWTFIKTQQ
jgi:hypothetical protein